MSGSTRIRVLAVFLLTLSNGANAAAVWPTGDAEPAPPAPMATVQVVFSTSAGSFTVELFPDRAPGTVENFLRYVDAGFYNGKPFYPFVAKVGPLPDDFADGAAATHPLLTPVENESKNGLRIERGSVSMLQHDIRNNATARFFVNVDRKIEPAGGDRDPAHTVFGRITAGMQVLDELLAVPVTSTHSATIVSAQRRPYSRTRRATPPASLLTDAHRDLFAELPTAIVDGPH